MGEIYYYCSACNVKYIFDCSVYGGDVCDMDDDVDDCCFASFVYCLCVLRRDLR